MFGCPSCDVGSSDPCLLCGDYDPLRAQYGPRYYDRAGNQIPSGRWMDLHEDFDYKVVRKTIAGHAEVSTVWLGLDHGFLPGAPPMIFETMIFELEVSVTPDDAPFFPGMRYHESDDFQARYSTESEAIAGHERVASELLGFVASLESFWSPAALVPKMRSHASAGTASPLKLP